MTNKTKQDLIDFIYNEAGKARATRFSESVLNKNGFSGLLSQIAREWESIGMLGKLSMTDMIRAYCKDSVRVPTCKTCGIEYINWSNKHQTWACYCSQKCTQNDPEVKTKNRLDDYTDSIAKRTKTNQERYGVEHISQLPEMKESFAERTKAAWNDPTEKEKMLQKRIETNLGRYNVEHVSQHQPTRSRAVEGILARFRGMSDAEKNSMISNYRKSRINPTAFDVLSSKEQLSDLYLTQRTSVFGISKLLGCSGEAVVHAIHYMGIPYSPDRMQNQVSLGELELLEFIQGIRPDAIHTYKDGKHLDVYIPDLKIGFEFNGIYWHSDKKKSPSYHQEKVDYFYRRGIRYIQVWEDDWNRRKETVQNFIRNLLGCTSRIGARKTKVVELTQSEFDSFMNANHMQGATIASVRLGLVDSTGDVVSAMGFKKIAKNIGRTGIGYDLNRFANSNVTGAFGKLLSHFLKNNSVDYVLSFGDLEIIDQRNNVYLKNGFEFDGYLNPDYRYYDYRTKKRQHKFGYRKEFFESVGLDLEGKTERELADEYRLLRCYDSGKIRYILIPNQSKA